MVFLRLSARTKCLLSTTLLLAAIFILEGCGGGGSTADAGSSSSGSNSGYDSGKPVGGSGVSTSPLISWTKPATYANGSPLTDLAGFRIYYGKFSRDYTDVIDINDPNATEFTVQNLPAGIYYFTVTAYNASGQESNYSAETVRSL